MPNCLGVSSYVPLEIIFIGKASSTNFALVPDSHVSVLVMVPVLSHRIKALVALFAPMPELIQMPEHVFFYVLLIHKGSEAKIADSPVGVFKHVMVVKFAVLLEGSIANIAAVYVTLSLLYVPEEHEFVDEELLASQALEMGDVNFWSWT